MADRNVIIFCAAADKSKADILAAAFPMGAGAFQRAVATTPGQSDLGVAVEWLAAGWMHEDLVAAFEASARLAEIGGMLELEEDSTLIAPYIVIPLDGTDAHTVIASRGRYLIEIE